MSSRQVRGRGQLEREVLACVAAADRPVSANDVLADLGGGLAYTTVMTTLARLESKGVLGRELRGRSYLYALAGDPADVESSLAAHRMRRVLESRQDRAGDPADVESSLAAHRMRRVLESRQDRAGILARFVADLSEEDERVLVDLLAEHGNGKPRDRGSA